LELENLLDSADNRATSHTSTLRRQEAFEFQRLDKIGVTLASGLNGFADSLLHHGAKHTPILEMELTFGAEAGETKYYARWAAATGGTLIFTEERVEFRPEGFVV